MTPYTLQHDNNNIPAETSSSHRTGTNSPIGGVTAWSTPSASSKLSPSSSGKNSEHPSSSVARGAKRLSSSVVRVAKNWL